jgi:DNA primase
MTDLSKFIIAQLQASGVVVADSSSSRDEIKAYCFKGHDSKSPSLSIRKSDGTFYCFGCGVKGRGWNALAKAIGADQLAEEDLPDPFSILHEELTRKLEAQDEPVGLPWSLEPWTKGKYRGLSTGFLKRLGARLWYDDAVGAYRIFFPIYQRKRLLGWVARRLDNHSEMKYRNAPKMRSTDILYPFDFIHEAFEPTTVALVEGPMDALRLCHLKIPALAIMGTNNWRKRKRSLLLSLGVERVVICTDGDPAGLKCRYEMQPDLIQWFDVEHYFPPEGEDPGGMGRDYTDQLKKMVNSEHT